MRTVPCRPPLKRLLRRCSTKAGKSSRSAWGVHTTASSLAPAMEVKVPHSWTMRPESAENSCESPADRKQQSEATTRSERNFTALLLGQFGAGDHRGEGFALGAEKVGGQIARE